MLVRLLIFTTLLLSAHCFSETRLSDQIETWQLHDHQNLSLLEIVGTPNTAWEKLPNNQTNTNFMEVDYWKASMGQAIWIKLKLPRLVNTERVWVELSPNVGLDGKLAIRKNDHWEWMQPAGRQGSEAPNYPATFLTFVIDNPRDHRLAFIKVNSTQILHFSVDVRTDKSQDTHLAFTNMFNGFVFGLLVLAIIYNLAIGISAGEKLYLYYAAYVLSTLLYLVAMTGFIRLTFPEWGGNGSFSNLSVLLAIFTATLFVRELLQTNRTTPKLDVLLKIQQFAIFVSIFLIGFVSDLVAYALAETLGVIAPVSILLTGLLAYKRKHSLAKYFLIAWTLFIATSSIWAWTWLGFVETGIDTLRLFILGSVIEVMLLSLVLGQRYADLKRQTADLNARKSKYIHQSETDSLTGLYSRQGIYSQVKHMLKNAKSEHIWLEVDIDNFGQFNAVNGDIAGDELLYEFGQILQTKVRRDNLASKLMDKENSFSYRRGVVGRTSGGKFTLLLSNCSVPQGRLYTERLMKDLSAIKVKNKEGKWVSASVSIGVIMVLPGEAFDGACQRASHKINETKNKGSGQLSFP